MTQTLSVFLDRQAPALEQALQAWLPRSATPGAQGLNRAVQDAVFPGGKRMRPLFALLAAQGLGADPGRIMPLACAIEYLHSSSLIFDDLPAMDDAAVRRDRPSLHAAHGEGLAILAALALLNQTYRLFGAAVSGDPGRGIALLGELCEMLGPGGMIGGQAVDLHPDALVRTADCEGHYVKTTALTRLMFSAPAIALGAPDLPLGAMARFGTELGLVYQTLDDLLDRVEDARRPLAPCDAPRDPARIFTGAMERLERAKDNLALAFPGGAMRLLLAMVDEVFGQFQRAVAAKGHADSAEDTAGSHSSAPAPAAP